MSREDQVMAQINNSGEIERSNVPRPGRRGFNAPCLRCGKAGEVVVFIHDLTGESSFNCGKCDQSWSHTDARNVAAAWSRVVQWIDQAPTT